MENIKVEENMIEFKTANKKAKKMVARKKNVC